MKSHLGVWEDVQILKDKVKELESTVLGLLAEVNNMQQVRRPGRPRKDAEQRQNPSRS